MNPIILSWVSITTGLLALVLGTIYYAMEQKKPVLRVSAGVLVTVCVTTNFISRM